MLGDPARQQVVVYLPPRYDGASTQRYPSVYLLTPFDGAPSTWTRAWPGLFGPRPGVEFIDSVMAAGEVPPMIVVMPNGRNRYHGSFFFNSPVSGNWEDFLTRDVVRHVDRTYRTIPQAESRGVAGHSMGGNAAVHIGMRNPDVFGAVYALSACCLGGYELFGMSAWERVLGYGSFDALERAYQQGDFPAMVLVAAGVTITPNRDRPPFFVDLPYTAYTLPQAGATFPDGWYVDVQNRGVGTITITPTVSTIDGASSLALTTNQGTRIFSNGTNYYTMRGVGGGGGGGGQDGEVLLEVRAHVGVAWIVGGDPAIT